MAEEKKHPEGAAEAPSEAANTRRPRTSPKKRRQQSALRYITILFATAFVLLLFTFLMERRQNEAMMQENQEQIDSLKQSVSAVQSLQGLYEENEFLKLSIAELETEIEKLKQANETLADKLDTSSQALDTAKRSLNAMDWFWQIDEAYVRGRYALCRSLIETLDAAGLTDTLPRVSITDNERFSPYDRLAEIRAVLY